MDRRGFLARGAALAVAALAVPALATPALASAEGLEIITSDASSLIEGAPVPYPMQSVTFPHEPTKDMVFFVETSGNGRNRVRRIGARNMHGREAHPARMKELVAEFAIVVKASDGTINTFFGTGDALTVADNTLNAKWVDVYVLAPGDTKWFQAVTA